MYALLLKQNPQYCHLPVPLVDVEECVALVDWQYCVAGRC